MVARNRSGLRDKGKASANKIDETIFTILKHSDKHVVRLSAQLPESKNGGSDKKHGGLYCVKVRDSSHREFSHTLMKEMKKHFDEKRFAKCERKVRERKVNVRKFSGSENENSFEKPTAVIITVEHNGNSSVTVSSKEKIHNKKIYMKNFRNYEYQQEKQAKTMTSINELTLIETVERIKDEVAILTSRFIEGDFDKEMQFAKLSSLNQLSN